MRISGVLRKIKRVLKDVLVRRHIREINFYFATISFRECLSLLLMLLRSYSAREDVVRGSYIKRFEETFAKYLGVRSVYSFGSGRMAFYALLKAFGIREEDEIILPAFTCAVVPNAIMYLKAKPVYVDIDPETFNMDISQLECKITPKTRIIIAQHTFGLPADMDKIMAIASKYNLKVIEDCAQSLGAEYKGRKVGVFGDASFFSFELSKVITTGWGGIAVTNDAFIKEKLEEEQGRAPFLSKKKVRGMVTQIIFSCFLYHPWVYWLGKYILMILYKTGAFAPSITRTERQGEKPVEFPYRLSNIQSMLGLSQLQKLKEINEHSIMIAERYVRMFKETEFRKDTVNKNTYKHIYLRYAFDLSNKNEALESFREHQIELGEWFNQVIVCTDVRLDKMYYTEGSCPNAERVVKQTVNLPTHCRLSHNDVKRIINISTVFLADKGGIKINGFC